MSTAEKLELQTIAPKQIQATAPTLFAVKSYTPEHVKTVTTAGVDAALRGDKRIVKHSVKWLRKLGEMRSVRAILQAQEARKCLL